MSGYAELLVRLVGTYADRYNVELQFSRPGTDADTEPDAGQMAVDFDRLSALFYDIPAYGTLLTDTLFADAGVRTAFEQARTAADLLQLPLRFRLFIDSASPELHALRWETLRDPRDGSALLTGERILFSRYLRSPDFRPVQRRGRADLRALVLVASPTDIEQYRPEGVPLQPLDVDAELAQAMDGLGNLQATTLAGRGRPTMAMLREHLLHEQPDVLYILCHGALIRDQPMLYLEGADGRTARTAGAELASALGELREPPTLVVLASCQSAGSGETGALAALGPRLARVGVPAVVAMQGKLTLATAATFIARFFRELGGDGQIDRAVAVARGEVRDRPDAWMPVLFTRLKSGRIWAMPGELGGQQPFEKWPALIANIREGRCTPIIGTGLTDFLFGSTREVAQRWADTYRFPMAPHERQNLPQVAQYLAVAQGDFEFPKAELEKYLAVELRARHGDQLPEKGGGDLDEQVSGVGRLRRARDEAEPHRVLAQLPLPIYVTTNPDNLLVEALAEAGDGSKKDPQAVLCRWKDDGDWPESIYDRDPTYRPSVQRPLVYHLFGQFRARDTLVLTEDDYFDYLIGITRNDRNIPPAVIRAWNDTALLFLGFQVDDWNFRVLFRSIMNQGGRERRKKKAHVAVQIDPEEGSSLDPERARQYLEEYFQADDINIYWGSTEDFIRDLWQHWQQAGQRP
jgi:hypothetical protein